MDYKIEGDCMQLVKIALNSGETVIAEPGAMNFMQEDIEFTSKLGDGSEATSGFFGKIIGAGKRMLAKESMFLAHFTNKSEEIRYVGFSASYPGKIIAVDTSDYPNGLTCQKDAFLCADYGVHIGVTLTKKFGAGFFGGEGFILEKISGNGTAFLNAGGTVFEIQLRNQSIKVDTGCIVAFDSSIDFSIEPVKGFSMFFGGEGLFLSTLSGNGTVFLQSLPFSRFADRIIKSAPSIGGEKRGEQ